MKLMMYEVEVTQQAVVRRTSKVYVYAPSENHAKERAFELLEDYPELARELYWKLDCDGGSLGTEFERQCGSTVKTTTATAGKYLVFDPITGQHSDHPEKGRKEG